MAGGRDGRYICKDLARERVSAAASRVVVGIRMDECLCCNQCR